MKTPKLLLPLGAVLLTAFAATATPFNPAEVSADANWFVHADLDDLRDTKVGATIIEAVEKKHGRQLKAVKRMFSLNPITDLQAITLWGSGEKDQGVALIRGSFDPEHLTDLIGANESYKTSKHGGNTVHTWKDKEKKKIQHGAFFGDDLLVISDQKSFVTEALDVLDKSADSMDYNNYGNSSFMVGLVNLENLDIKGEEAKMFEKAKSVRGRFFEKGDRLHAELVIEATNNSEAERFRKILDGIVALGEVANEDLASLELGMTSSIKGGTNVTATMSVPNDRVLELLEEAGELGKFVD